MSKKSGVGFQRVIKTLGVERRLVTVGEHSGMHHPFGPLFAEDRGFLPALLEQLHGQLIRVVKEGRGATHG